MSKRGTNPPNINNYKVNSSCAIWRKEVARKSPLLGSTSYNLNFMEPPHILHKPLPKERGNKGTKLQIIV